VVEDGARATDSLLSVDDWAETTLILQGAGEPPVELPFRVMGRLAVLARANQTVGRAVLVIAPNRDAQSQAARELTCHALIAHMEGQGYGELVLAAPGAETQLRHDLMTLVEGLLCGHEGSSVMIRLEFHSEAPQVAPGHQVTDSGTAHGAKPHQFSDEASCAPRSLA
jgi:hypothetical protein